MAVPAPAQPRQAFSARIYVQQLEQGLSVPNVAVMSDAGKAYVALRGKDGIERREITLGARGPARSEVLSGLTAGDVVLLTPAATTEVGA